MARRRSLQSVDCTAALNAVADPALRELAISRTAKRRVLIAPGLIVGVLFAWGIRGFAGVMPWSWIAVAGAAFGMPLASALFLVHHSLRNFDQYDESRAWAAGTVAVTVAQLAFLLALAHVNAVHADPAEHPLRPQTWDALVMLAAALGLWCAAGAGLCTVFAVALVHGWADHRRWRQQRDYPHRVAARAARGAASLLSLLTVGQNPPGTSKRDVVHLLRVAGGLTRVSIWRAAGHATKGQPRRTLRAYRGPIDAGFADLEEAVHDRARHRAAVTVLRRLADRLENEWWAEVVEVFGPAAQQAAARRRKQWRDTAGVLAAALVLGLTFVLPHQQASWIGPVPLLAFRSAVVGLGLMRALAVARRTGWVDTREYGALRRVATALIEAPGGRLPPSSSSPNGGPDTPEQRGEA